MGCRVRSWFRRAEAAHEGSAPHFPTHQVHPVSQSAWKTQDVAEDPADAAREDWSAAGARQRSDRREKSIELVKLGRRDSARPAVTQELGGKADVQKINHPRIQDGKSYLA